MAGEGDALVERLDLLARLRQRAFALAELHVGVQSCAHAVADQRERLLALRERALGHRALIEQARKLHVDRGDPAGEQQARGLQLGPCSTLAAQRGLQLGTLAAEEIQLPGGGGLHRAAVVGRTRQRRWQQAVLAVALARGVGGPVHLRPLGRAGAGDRRAGAFQPGLGRLQVGMIGQRAVDQRIERGIVEAAPPVRGQVQGRGLHGGGQAGTHRVERRRVGRDAGAAGAAGEHQRRDQRGQASGGVGDEGGGHGSAECVAQAVFA